MRFDADGFELGGCLWCGLVVVVVAGARGAAGAGVGGGGWAREVRGGVVEDFKVGEGGVGAVFLGLGDERGPLAGARAVAGAGGGALMAAVAGGAGVGA